MAELKDISLPPVGISTSKTTKFLTIKQGENEISLSRDAINNLRMLREGKFENSYNMFSRPMLKTKFSMDENQNITATCDNDTVVLRKTKRYDDVKRILEYTDKHKKNIAWEREFRRRR